MNTSSLTVEPQQDNTPQETVIYQGPNVYVSNRRAVLGGKTYAIQNVTSVEMLQKSLSFTPITILILVGGIVGLCGIYSNMSRTLIGLGVLVALGGVAVMLSRKPAYIVKIGSASGESQALQSADRAEIERVVEAMNRAIVSR